MRHLLNFKANHRESGEPLSAAALTAFGETLENGSVRSTPTPSTYTSFYTGKPEVVGLGHAFLFRNYRASLAKWQTADPLGYPDGWNQLAYCGNQSTISIDYFGGKRVVVSFMDALNHYAYGYGEAASLHSSVILQSVSSSGYFNAIQRINSALKSVSHDENTGILRLSSSYGWEQGDILGRTTVRWSISLRWYAGGWQEMDNGYSWREVYGDGIMVLDVSDDWDFNVHDGDSLLRSIFGEIIPLEIASLYSVIVSSGIGESFSLSGSAFSREHFSVIQVRE